MARKKNARRALRKRASAKGLFAGFSRGISALQTALKRKLATLF